MFREFSAVALGCLLSMVAPTTFAEDTGYTLPAIKVVTDCGECKVGNNVIEIISASYAETAKKLGATVSADEEMTVTIKEYNERTKAASLLLGWFSGKDVIVADCTFHDKHYRVKDISTSSYFGIESVAKVVGKRLVRNLLATLVSNGKVTPGVVNDGEIANPVGELRQE